MVLITSALSNLQNDHILTINFSRSGRISGTRSAPLVVHASPGNPQESTEIRNDGWSRQFLKWHLMEQRGPVFWLELVLMMLVTAPFRWASKALPSLLDYRDRMSEREGTSGIDRHAGDWIEDVEP